MAVRAGRALPFPARIARSENVLPLGLLAPTIIFLTLLILIPVAQAVLLGGNVRVGLEDNIWLEKGVYATNGKLVEKAIKIIELLGARPVTPAEARQKLGLKPR